MSRLLGHGAVGIDNLLPVQNLTKSHRLRAIKDCTAVLIDYYALNLLIGALSLVDDVIMVAVFDKNRVLPITLTLSRQLYIEIRRLIASGAFECGRRLPSTRELARRLNLSRATVTQAYQKLIDDGYAEALCGSGTFVRREFAQSRSTHRVTDSESGPAVDVLLPLSQWGQALSGKMPSPADSSKMEASSPTVAFTPEAESTRLDAPVHQWRRLLARHINSLSFYDCAEDPCGNPLLREAIADYLSTWRGLEFAPDRIIILASSAEALDLIARVHIERGDTVAVENPGVPLAHRIFEAHGAKLRGIPVDSCGMAVDALLRKEDGSVKLAYVTPAEQLPLGPSLSVERRYRLVDWASRTGTVIIEDDYGGYPHAAITVPPLKSLNCEAPVVFMGTFSKLLLPSANFSYILLPDRIAPVYKEARRLTGGAAGQIEQQALAEFLRRGQLEKHIRRARDIYNSRRKVLVDALKRHFGDTVTICGKGSGTHLIVRLSSPVDDQTMLELARRSGVAIATTAALYLTGNGSTAGNGEFILNYGRADEKQIVEGIERLACALRALCGSNAAWPISAASAVSF